MVKRQNSVELSPDLQRALFLWEHKSAEIAGECRKFLDLREKLKSTERGSEEYHDLIAKMDAIATMLEAKGQSLQDIDEEIAEALPKED